MKIRTIAAIVAVAAVPSMAWSSNDLSAQTASPIATVDQSFEAANYGAELYTPGYAHVAFVNNSPIPATQVQFALTDDGYVVATLVDNGHFAPGTKIRKTWSLDSDTHHPKLTVARVTFVDGSSWSEYDVAQPNRQAVSFNDSPTTGDNGFAPLQTP